MHLMICEEEELSKHPVGRPMAKTGCQVLVLLSRLVVALCSANVALAYPWTTVAAIVAFGDSLVNAGTNKFIDGSTTQADFLPYGETIFHRATGRFSTERLALDFIASRLGLRPFKPPFLQPGFTFEKSVNFASGSSGVLSTTGHGDGVIPLTTQVSQFQQVATKLTSDLGAAAAGNSISNSMHFFATGSNDLLAFFRIYSLQQIFSPTNFVTSTLSKLQAHAQTMCSESVRKLVIFGIGPLGCSPQAMAAADGTNGVWADRPTQWAQAYNAALLQLFNAKLPNVHAVIDSFHIMRASSAMEIPEAAQRFILRAAKTDLFYAALQCGHNDTTFVFSSDRRFSSQLSGCMNTLPSLICTMDTAPFE